MSGCFWIQGTRNQCHSQWHKPTIFTISASCGTKNSAAQLRGQGLCCDFIFIALIPPRHYLHNTVELTALTCIIVTTFAGNSFPNSWCKSASLLLGVFCHCIFRQLQEGLPCLHMPVLPCVGSSWIWVFQVDSTTAKWQNGFYLATNVLLTAARPVVGCGNLSLERSWLLCNGSAPKLFLHCTGHRY